MNPILILSVVLIYTEAVLSSPICNVPGVVTKIYKKGDDSPGNSGNSNGNNGAFTASVCPANKIAQIQLVDTRYESTLTYTKCPSCANDLTLQYDADYCNRNSKDIVCNIIKNIPGLSDQCFLEIRIYSCQVPVTTTKVVNTTPIPTTEAPTPAPTSAPTEAPTPAPTPAPTTEETTTPTDTTTYSTTPKFVDF